MSLFDELILSQSLPDVLELIFLRHLSPPDLESCLLVSDRWREVLSAHLLRREAPRRACLSARLAHAWTRAELTFTRLDLGSGNEDNNNKDRGRMSVCFVDCSEEDVVVVLTRHGQRRCLVLRLDPQSGGATLARAERVFPAALAAVLAAGDLLVFQLAGGSHPCQAADRRTLGEVEVRIGGRGAGGKRLTVAGQEEGETTQGFSAAEKLR